MCHEALASASISHFTSFHLISPSHNKNTDYMNNKRTAMSSGVGFSHHNNHQASSALERRRMGQVHSARVLFSISASSIVLL